MLETSKFLGVKTSCVCPYLHSWTLCGGPYSLWLAFDCHLRLGSIFLKGASQLQPSIVGMIALKLQLSTVSTQNSVDARAQSHLIEEVTEPVALTRDNTQPWVLGCRNSGKIVTRGKTSKNRRSQRFQIHRVNHQIPSNLQHCPKPDL